MSSSETILLHSSSLSRLIVSIIWLILIIRLPYTYFLIVFHFFLNKFTKDNNTLLFFFLAHKINLRKYIIKINFFFIIHSLFFDISDHLSNLILRDYSHSFDPRNQLIMPKISDIILTFIFYLFLDFSPWNIFEFDITEDPLIDDTC